MNRLSAIMLASLILFGPLGASAADSMGGMAMGKLTVTAAFSPAPAKQGMQVIKITVKDAMGKPVKGAVVKVATNMPTMSMTGPTVLGHEVSSGIYTAKINLNFATEWTFDVSAGSGSQKGAAHLKADVK